MMNDIPIGIINHTNPTKAVAFYINYDLNPDAGTGRATIFSKHLADSANVPEIMVLSSLLSYVPARAWDSIEVIMHHVLDCLESNGWLWEEIDRKHNGEEIIIIYTMKRK